ncbi:hypothetical protein HYFRA_00006226 [Hymenoscyphus fraxineus]|uniref:Amidase domain-containing protein n=1 Tax=Hymenoscyphus fraxineus TaxID=746836 RepID=A0A9N9PVS3_9HELO|nr:hypothetical protein HYFRA_00006226 [Hymenoscyphus fraxineus]
MEPTPQVRSPSSRGENPRDAGAIILVKASCSEWSNSRSPEKSISGWSAVGGQGNEVCAINQSPLESLSGSAVASSLGLVAAALDMEWRPLEVSRRLHGVYCVTEWKDSVDMLGKTVLDIATVLTAMAGIDELDNLTSADPRDEGQALALRSTEGTDFTVNRQKNSLRGLRIAVQVPVPRHCIEQPEVVNTHLNEALKKLEALGATVIEDVEFTMWSPKYPNNMSKFLESFSVDTFALHNLSDLMEYTKTPEENFEEYGMKQWLQAERCRASILFAGRTCDDERLIAAAYVYEQGTHHRETFKPVIELPDVLEIGASDVSNLFSKTKYAEYNSSQAVEA